MGMPSPTNCLRCLYSGRREIKGHLPDALLCNWPSGTLPFGKHITIVYDLRLRVRPPEWCPVRAREEK